MKKKITYHQKLLYTLVGGAIFSIVLYSIALSDTIDLAIENNILTTEIAKNQDAPQQIKSIKKRLAKIQQLIGDNENYEEVDIHQVLLASVTEYVHNNGMILKDFPIPYALSEKGYVTKTATVTVEGGFIPLLKLVYYLENDYNVGKVVAVDFITTKQLRTRKRKLNTIIYLQNVKTANHEGNS